MPSRGELLESSPEAPLDEPTLARVLTDAVRSNVPTWLYQLLHLALPLAVDFGFRGWWRAAAGATVLTAFGAWGLADRWLWNETGDDRTRGWLTRVVWLGRGVAGAVSGVLAAVLLLELFLRLLGSPPGH